ncbi:MAG: [acyl-carrier-protein] S-malonyltransferase [Proteobacteria bacterium]|nr:[acyl-carrier-protein] S-malonyltransferase [Pseudomonadota bacterium]
MPRHISLIFPGQGSQSIGMLNSFSGEELNIVSKISKEVLEIDLVDCIENGPEEVLNKTSITQPALLIASYLYYKKFLDLFDITPNLLAGHSLGEYSALVASNSIKVDDAISLVHKRGNCMEKSQKGSMFAILNLDINEINQICKVVEEETGQIISPANINSPNQVVIAGSHEAATIAAEKCKEAGAKRCIQLKVSVASHCNLMYEAASLFKKELDKHKFYTPEISIIHNVDAKTEEDITNIPKKLTEQLTLPVQWTKTMEYIKTFNGIVIECGPGKVLSGLAKTNGLDNILSMSSESFEDDLKELL